MTLDTMMYVCVDTVYCMVNERVYWLHFSRHGKTTRNIIFNLPQFPQQCHNKMRAHGDDFNPGRHIFRLEDFRQSFFDVPLLGTRSAESSFVEPVIWVHPAPVDHVPQRDDMIVVHVLHADLS